MRAVVIRAQRIVLLVVVLVLMFLLGSGFDEQLIYFFRWALGMLHKCKQSLAQWANMNVCAVIEQYSYTLLMSTASSKR